MLYSLLPLGAGWTWSGVCGQWCPNNVLFYFQTGDLEGLAKVLLAKYPTQGGPAFTEHDINLLNQLGGEQLTLPQFQGVQQGEYHENHRLAADYRVTEFGKTDALDTMSSEDRPRSKWGREESAPSCAAGHGISCCDAFPEGYADITPRDTPNGPGYLKVCAASPPACTCCPTCVRSLLMRWCAHIAVMQQ